MKLYVGMIRIHSLSFPKGFSQKCLWTRWFNSWPFDPRSLEVAIRHLKGWRITIPKRAQRIERDDFLQYSFLRRGDSVVLLFLIRNESTEIAVTGRCQKTAAVDMSVSLKTYCEMCPYDHCKGSQAMTPFCGVLALPITGFWAHFARYRVGIQYTGKPGKIHLFKATGLLVLGVKLMEPNVATDVFQV